MSGFDYVTVDALRRRVYAAHTGSRALTIVDADSGKLLGQVRVGHMHGVAVDSATGIVYTGDGESNTVSEVDPVAMKVLRTAEVGGTVDAIAYDAASGHIYADEDDGTHVYVVDAKTMKSIGTIDVPGHKPEYLAVDPASHELYQNIANLSEIAVVDPTTLKVTRTIATPEITNNHPLMYDATYHHLIVGGANSTIAVYDRAGKLLGKTAIQPSVDQCSLSQTTHVFVCAGSSVVTVLKDTAAGVPTIVSQTPAERGAHTVGIDEKTGNAWLVWAAPSGDFIQGFASAP